MATPATGYIRYVYGDPCHRLYPLCLWRVLLPLIFRYNKKIKKLPPSNS
jgi:hypothetical protein